MKVKQDFVVFDNGLSFFYKVSTKLMWVLGRIVQDTKSTQKALLHEIFYKNVKSTVTILN